MFARLFGGVIVLVLVTQVVSVGAPGEKKGKDDPNEVVGVSKSVDLKGKFFVITLKTGKDRKFLITKMTKFVGPRGGKSSAGLKDDRMAKGYTLKVIPSKDGKTAAQVKLPYRKRKKKKSK